MRIWCIFSLLSFFLVGSNHYAKGQQYIPFAQHVFNSSHINPAYVGYKDGWFAQMGIRSQWAQIDGAPKSGYASIDGVLDRREERHGVGVQLAFDKIGVQSATSFFGSYALRLQIDDDDNQRLNLGISAGITQYSLNGNKLQYIDENDPYIPQGMITTWRPDLRLGVFYYHPNWYAGVALHDLFSNSDKREDFVYNQNSLQSLYRNTHGYLMLGAALPFSAGFVFRPSLLVKDDFIGPTALDINVMAVFDNKFWIGGGYRSRSKIFNRKYEDLTEFVGKYRSYKSLTLLTQLYTSSKLRIGYSFEHSLNKIAGMNNGTHEISLGVSLGSSNNRFATPKYF